jgi:hypothetical protein
MRYCFLVLATLLVVGGCGSKDDVPDWPPFAMTIPDDVPDQMTLIDKKGIEHQGNGKELWAGGYRAGWKRCVYDFDKGHLDLAVEYPEPPALGDYGIVVRGWNAGYLACWKAIREAKMAH